MNNDLRVLIDESEETRQVAQGKISLDGKIVLFVLRRHGFDWKLEFRDEDDVDFLKPPLFTSEGILNSDDLDHHLKLDLAFENLIFDAAERYFIGRCKIGQPVDYRRLVFIAIGIMAFSAASILCCAAIFGIARFVVWLTQ